MSESGSTHVTVQTESANVDDEQEDQPKKGLSPKIYSAWAGASKAPAEGTKLAPIMPKFTKTTAAPKRADGERHISIEPPTKASEPEPDEETEIYTNGGKGPLPTNIYSQWAFGTKFEHKGPKLAPIAVPKFTKNADGKGGEDKHVQVMVVEKKKPIVDDNYADLATETQSAASKLSKASAEPASARNSTGKKQEAPSPKKEGDSVYENLYETLVDTTGKEPSQSGKQSPQKLSGSNRISVTSTKDKSPPMSINFLGLQTAKENLESVQPVPVLTPNQSAQDIKSLKSAKKTVPPRSITVQTAVEAKATESQTPTLASTSKTPKSNFKSGSKSSSKPKDKKKKKLKLKFKDPESKKDTKEGGKTAKKEKGRKGLKTICNVQIFVC